MIASLVEPKYPLESLHWKIKCSGLLCQQHLIEHLVVLQLFTKKRSTNLRVHLLYPTMASNTKRQIKKLELLGLMTLSL